MLGKIITVFFISMVPLIELRGAIPFATAFGLMEGENLPLLIFSYIVCILGNMFPVPFIYYFARKFLEWGQDKKFIGKICSFFLVKGANAGKKLEEKAGKGLFLALLLFVAIPVPGTGAWTGTLAASLLNMKFKDTVISVMLGVLIAGIIMLLVSLAGKGIFNSLNTVSLLN